MNVEELIRAWPGVDKFNAERFLDSPAWRMQTSFAGRDAVVTGCPAETVGTDLLELDIALDGEPHRLGLADSETFPDLHRLWSRRRALPAEVLLALVENECGALLQCLENSFRQELSLRGVADAVPAGTVRRAFRLTDGAGGIAFALDLSPAMALSWGKVRNIDTGHATVRGLVRPAWAEYAALDLIADEEARLVPGGALLLPDVADGTWRTEIATDDLVHVYAAEASQVSFAQMADDDWPAVPAAETGPLVCVKNGRKFADGVLVRVGTRRAVKIV